MSTFVNKSVIVIVDDDKVRYVRDYAVSLFGNERCVSNVVPTLHDNAGSFFISPSDYKIGTDEDKQHEENLKKFCDWIDDHRILPAQYAYVVFGDDIDVNFERVVRSSHPDNEFRKRHYKVVLL